ncbi:DUF3667 domain-containing protein [Pontibacter burrus]|uniref:DUF3667 domain-containing protein n=1 Tax=Pontibacter burrus TaxID=2704466 RepID=A0A6B3LJT4_9BACT|nr:DUF3667 domain-containing protein [Pontibacter burrus]NEM96979.1 DUF3667 domain-containing protein [Pontibacter burrus]
MKKHYRSENNCLNCDTIVADKFCPSCGQENLELRENFLHLLLHSVGHYFHFESKFFNSIVPLLTKPGYLTKEYFAGKRASHLNPISMYISISILFFFLFTLDSNSNKKDILKEGDAKENTISEPAKSAINSTIPEKSGDDNIENLQNNSGPATESTSNYSASLISTAEEDGNTSSLVNESALPQSFRDKLKKLFDDDLNRQLFMNKLTSHLPKMMFILLPLFALILKLVNYRSKKYFAEHLIYSIHVHSFLFLFGSIYIVLEWILPFLDDWLMFTGLAIMIWYIYRSMRNTYRSSRWRTVYKFIVLAFAYTFLLLLSGIIVAIGTLYTM